MTNLTAGSEARVGIGVNEDKAFLEIRICKGEEQYSFGLSPSDARALSLELVRQASQAESRFRQPHEASRTLSLGQFVFSSLKPA